MTFSEAPPGLDERAAGVLVASACGDALGAGYEFGPPLPPGTPVGMIGGGLGPFAPGEWTDDTSMAIPIAQAAATGLDLRGAGLDAVAAGFHQWFETNPPDVGNQTRAVLAAAQSPTAAATTESAKAFIERNPGKGAGNGALMRTAPVALAHFPDDLAVRDASVLINNLTHADPTSAEACIIWSVGIAHALQEEGFTGVRSALSLLPADRARFWAERLDEAEAQPPSAFPKNGWVVHALQAAWSAISRTPIPTSNPSDHLRLALEEAVRAGRDTDTVACIAGGLLGARWGLSAVPLEWREMLHGYPRLTAADLVELALSAVRNARARHAKVDG